MSNNPKIQQSKNPIPIDLLLSVVDNFGDMGFACELMISYESHFPGRFHFRVFTDNVGKVDIFLRRNTHLLGKYEVVSYEKFNPQETADIIFALFHFPLPVWNDDQRRLILRFDYLSLDPKWVNHNEIEHITSNNCTKIIEIIPSFLPGGSGVIQHFFLPSSREKWLEDHGLDRSIAEKVWINMFIYGSINDLFDRDSFPENVHIFVLGQGDIPVFSPGTSTYFPLLPIDEYYSLLSFSDFNIVRGEVSVVQAMQSRKPLLWDMYKEIGGFPAEQSEQFLMFGKFDPSYRSIHTLLNQEATRKITWQDIEQILENEKAFPVFEKENVLNLVQETKKHIDRFYFSL